MAPRIALLGLQLESNGFAPPVTEADFHVLAGEAILAEAAKPAPALAAEYGGFLRAMFRHGPFVPVPIFTAGAQPGGPAEHTAFAGFMEEIDRRLAAEAPLDAAYICSHGAMTTTKEADPDGLLYELVRRRLGPGKPIVATVDLHANISEAMVAAVDLIVGYRTNPHVDQAERGAEAADVLHDLLGGLPLHVAHIRLPLVAPSVSLLTATGPYADLIADGQRRQAASGGRIVNVSVLGGFVFSDTPKNGLTMLVAARDQAAADGLARELARRAWLDRERFRARLTSLEDAVKRAREVWTDPRRPAVCLADVADNPGGGGRGNTTFILQALLTAGVQEALLGLFWDPQLAEEAHLRGVGKRFLATFNRGGHIGYTRRFQAEATVVALAAGEVVGSLDSIYAGRTVHLGPMAALDLGGIVVAVASRRQQLADPAFLAHLGLDVGRARVVVVKSRGHFRAGFRRYFGPEQIVEVDAAGLTSPVLERFDFQNLPRPVWPLDPETTWP